MQSIQRSMAAGSAVPTDRIIKSPHAASAAAAAGDSTVPTTAAAVIGGPLDYLTYTVKLLSGIRWDTLDKLDAAADGAKRLAVYRGIRTQKFLEFTEQKIRDREAALKEVWESMRQFWYSSKNGGMMTST